MRDLRVATAMVDALAAQPPRVLEIGAGRGALTGPLLTRFPRVRAVELDGRLAESLAARLGEPEGLEVWRADALHDDLDELAGDGPWQVAANLPYAVATPIVRRLLRRPDLTPRLVVMVQREVAQRLLAPPGSPHRGLVSVEVELFARARWLLDVAPGAFSPPPRVTSTVLVLDVHPPLVPAVVVERALALAGRAFTQRRKQLINALAGMAPGALLGEALRRAGCGEAWRAQQVGGEQWVTLAQGLPGPGQGGGPCG